MKNFVVAAVCTALGAAAWVLTLSFPSPAELYRSPSIYPRVVIVTIVILCLVLAAGTLLRRRAPVAPDGDEPAAPRSYRLPLVLIGAMIGYYVLLQLVGFSVATFAFLLAMFLVFGGSLRRGLLFAAGMTAGQYIVFVYLLNVRAPDPVVRFISSLL